MATGTFKWYGKGMENILKGSVNLSSDTIKCMLTTSSYTPDQDTHDFRNDVTNEITGTGYTAGGATVASESISYDAASNEVRWVFADVAWTTATIASARVAVLYKSRGGASSADELIGYMVFDGDVSVTAGTLTLDVPATSVGKVTVA